MKMGNSKIGTCTHYCEKSKSCLARYCKVGNRLIDENKNSGCKKDGKIYDIFRERDITNYEFMKSRYTE